jgi:Xaa-Pro aminopeptidase
MRVQARRKQAIQAAVAAGAEALLVTHGPDVRYLSGFTGSSGAVAIVGGRATLFTDGRYSTQAKAEVQAAGSPAVRVVINQRPPAVQAVEWLAAAGVTRCAFDATQTTVAAMEAIKKALPSAVRRSFLVSTDGLVAKIRQVKDADEIILMRKAAALGCRLFEDVLEYVVAGATEAEVAAQLEFKARMAGAEAMSFETIVTGAERTALPWILACCWRVTART